MGNAESNSNTYVANATGFPIRVYYSVDKMRLEEMVVDARATVEGSTDGKGSGSASAETKQMFRADSRIRYIRIPANDFSKFAGEGTIYASVFCEHGSRDNECINTISVNFHIPSDRSFIVTRKLNIRFQKYGESIWMDEQGIMHN